MSAKTEIITNSNNTIIIDDVGLNNQKDNKSDDMEDDKLAELRAKLAATQTDDGDKDMAIKIMAKKTHSIKFGVVGSGQAGSRIAESFYNLGYSAVAINTAQQDLEHISIPEDNKLLLDFGLGGAAKEIDIGKEAAEAYKDHINELVASKLGDSQVLIFCTSLGGGSGAGSCETIIDILSTFGRPVVVITVLPMSNEDAQTKNNALQTLAKLSKAIQSKLISNLIVIDNAKIETIYKDVSQLDFFEVSNNAIVETLDVFNTLSSMPSSVKSLDPMEFGKLLTDGEGLSVYGQMSVPNYQDATGIAEAVISNLNSNLLSAGFNLKQSRYVGVMMAAPKKVWDKVPAESVNYAMAMVNDICGTPRGVFRGIYTIDSDEDVVKVYSMFSGLGLPDDRVQQLKKEAQEYMAASNAKDEDRNLTLKLDTGVEETVSAADRIKKQIAAKGSAFGKLKSNSIIDRRK